MLSGKAVNAFVEEKLIIHRENYRRLFESGEMEPLMVQLAVPDLDRCFIFQAHEVLHIPVETLRTWRKSLKKDPDFRPYSKPANYTKRALTDDQERRVFGEIQSGYLIPGLYCPTAVLQTLAVEAPNIATDGEDYQDYDDYDDYDDEPEDPEERQSGREPILDEPLDEEEVVRAVRRDLEFEDGGPSFPKRFVAGRHWRRNYMKRWRLSLRKPHPKRRPDIEATDVETFQDRMKRILRKHDRSTVFNMDETSWKQLNIGARTIAQTGVETVNCHFKADKKACLTAVATVNAAGEKLPLWVLCRGTTAGCETRYRTHQDINQAIAQGKLLLSHQVNGWSDDTIVAEYLRWLRGQNGRRHIVLLWDIFPSHRSNETKSLAARLKIQLEFVPPGMTGECQPLDRRIFGILKGRARSRFDHMCCQHVDPSTEESVTMLVDAWRTIEQDVILAAWEPLMP
jgi:hypothetical protein